MSQGADHGMGFQQANVEERGDGKGGGEVLPRDGYPSIEAQTLTSKRAAEGPVPAFSFKKRRRRQGGGSSRRKKFTLSSM